MAVGDKYHGSTRTAVVLRAHDDTPIVARTLAALRRQTRALEIVAFDNASRDGTRELLEQSADRLVDVPAGAYVPGRVLNDAMRATSGELVVMLNADCTPQHDDWLEQLLAGFAAPEIAAVFGRQIARPGHHPLHAKDTEQTYGDGARQQRWRHCFSMAAAAIRRSAWERFGFDEKLRYSEDIEWTWRLRRHGLRTAYVAKAVVMHSHDYDLLAFYRRHFGEGRAEARIFDWSPWQRSLLRYSILPFARQLADDVRTLWAQGERAAAAEAPLFRTAQLLGRRAGFVSGWRDRGGA